MINTSAQKGIDIIPSGEICVALFEVFRIQPTDVCANMSMERVSDMVSRLSPSFISSRPSVEQSLPTGLDKNNTHIHNGPVLQITTGMHSLGKDHKVRIATRK